MKNEKTLLALIIPVYNDWDSLTHLLHKVNSIYRDDIQNGSLDFRFFIIDDGSSEPQKIDPPEDLHFIHVIRLKTNLGHQRAIAVGLCYVTDNLKTDGIVVMDADGEDMPEHIIQLVREGIERKKIIFASRKKRHESIAFKVFYSIYKELFVILTGHRISFGNFCFIPPELANRLPYISEIWNHFSGGVIRSKIPYEVKKLNRGKRLAGKSKMNLVSLVIHGISSISIYLDVVAVRILLSSIFLIILSVIYLLGVLIIKYFTDLAIPGWATFTAFGLVIIILIAIMISMFMSLIILNSRNLNSFIPKDAYDKFILRVINAADEG
jgi:hypothetical protein